MAFSSHSLATTSNTKLEHYPSRRKPGNVAALLDLFPFRESESAGYRWLTDQGNGFALHLSERDR
jgi:hypothetical protein